MTCRNELLWTKFKQLEGNSEVEMDRENQLLCMHIAELKRGQPIESVSSSSSSSSEEESEEEYVPSVKKRFVYSRFHFRFHFQILSFLTNYLFRLCNFYFIYIFLYFFIFFYFSFSPINKDNEKRKSGKRFHSNGRVSFAGRGLFILFIYR